MKRALGRLVALTSVFTLLAACESDPDTADVALELANKAKLELDNGPQSLSQTSSRTWSLDKSGSRDPSTKTVTWSLVATQSSSTSNRLVANARVKIKNKGNAPATLGNVVVNLQRKVNGSWTTISRDITNETIGDAATTAKIISNGSVSTVAENAGSGTLSLSTPGPIPGNTTVNLDVTATFNNNALAIPTGAGVRVEVVITYGNANNGGGSAANVDIDGNGAIGPDEARVKSDAERFGEKAVPAPSSTSTTVALSDTMSDIETTGTVTFTNAVFNLGATTGTVTVSYAGGVDGGTLSNCGHLTGADVDVTDCDTQVIPREFEWHDGDQTTYSQVSWGIAGATSLFTGFDAVYTGTGGLLTVGLNYVMAFTGASYVISYLPETGSDGALVRNWLNPTSTEAGYFGANVVALQLDVDFADQNRLPRALATPFGDLTLCNFPMQPLLEGMTVRDLVADLNSLVGGGTGVYPISELSVLSAELSAAFDSGVVSQFARDHLMVGACP